MSEEEIVIHRVQNVYDVKGRPKITLPKEIIRRWGFPKKVLVEYDPYEDAIVVKPYRKWG